MPKKLQTQRKIQKKDIYRNVLKFPEGTEHLKLF